MHESTLRTMEIVVYLYCIREEQLVYSGITVIDLISSHFLLLLIHQIFPLQWVLLTKYIILLENAICDNSRGGLWEEPMVRERLEDNKHNNRYCDSDNDEVEVSIRF